VNLYDKLVIKAMSNNLANYIVCNEFEKLHSQVLKVL